MVSGKTWAWGRADPRGRWVPAGLVLEKRWVLTRAGTKKKVGVCGVGSEVNVGLVGFEEEEGGSR